VVVSTQNSANLTRDAAEVLITCIRHPPEASLGAQNDRYVEIRVRENRLGNVERFLPQKKHRPLINWNIRDVS